MYLIFGSFGVEDEDLGALVTVGAIEEDPEVKDEDPELVVDAELEAVDVPIKVQLLPGGTGGKEH